jgi:hypothetical protein
MALPRTGTLGQKVDYQGYVYQWTGVGWNNIGQSLLVVANTNIFANNNFTMGNSTVNTLITSAIITTGGATTNSVITIDSISVSNSITTTIINPRGVFAGNSTTNVTITANTFTVGNTSLSSNGIISGNSTANSVLSWDNVTVANSTGSTVITAGGISTNSLLTSSGFTVGNSTSNVSLTAANVFVGNSTTNTKITGNSFSVANTFVNANGVLIYRASPIPVQDSATAVNTNINANGLFVANNTGNTFVGAGKIIVSPNTVIAENSIFIGNSSSNVFINSSAIYITNGVNQSTGQPKQTFMNASFYSGTANNVLYLNGVDATNYVTAVGNFTLSGNLNFTAPNTFFTSNVNFFGGDKIYFDSGLNENYFTGTAYNALNADALGNYSVDVFELKQNLATDVGLLKSACSAFSDDSAKLGGVLAASYVTTSGNYTITGVHTHSSNTIFTKNVEIRGARLILNSTAIFANSSNGTYGQLLVSNGAGAFWDDAGALVDINATYVWTNTHQFANTIKFGNSTVYANIFSNTSGTFFGGTANNSNSLGGVIASSYALKTYADSSSATAASNAYTWAMANTLSRSGTYTGNNYFTGSNSTFSSANLNYTGTRFTITTGSQLVGNSSAYTFINSTSFAVSNSTTNVTITPILISVSNSTTNVSINSNKVSVGNTTVNLNINSTSIAIGTGTINATSYTGESNSSVYFGGATSSAYVNTTGNFTLGGNIVFNSNVTVSTIIANGTIGLGGQVLVSKGDAGNVFWATAGADGSGIGSVTSVATGNGVTGGPIVGFGTISVVANSGIVANSSGVFTNNEYIATKFASLTGSTFTGAVTIGNNLTVTGNLTLTGNTVIVGANNLVVQDAVMSIHTPADLGDLTSDDGKIVGIAYHYYDSAATNYYRSNIDSSTITLSAYAALAGYYRNINTNAIINQATYDGLIDYYQKIAGNGPSTLTIAQWNALSPSEQNNYVRVHQQDSYVTRQSDYTFVNMKDKQALIGLNQSNGVLTYYSDSTDARLGDPVGTSIGTFEANSLVVGNSVSRATINSTVYTGSSNNATYLAGLAATNYVNATGSYTFTGLHTHNANVIFNSNTTFKANVTVNSAIIAGGTSGTSGQVLTSNGSSNVYWSTVADILGGSISSISNSDYTIVTTDDLHGAGPITTSGKIKVSVGYGLKTTAGGITIANNDSSIGVLVTGVYVNTTWLSTQAANNAYYLVGVDGNKFVQNTDSRTLSGNLIFSANTTKFNSNVYFNGYISTNTIPESNNTQLLGNSTNRWLKLNLSGGSTGGIRLGNTFITDDASGTTDALVVNTFIANSATVNNATVNNFTANSTTLLNPLLANSGGTGANVYVIGDILYASATNALSTLSIPYGGTGSGIVANGQILQIVNNLPVWGNIDCGESSWAPL